MGPTSFWRDFSAAAQFKLTHSPGDYDAVHQIFSRDAMGAIAMMMLSGAAISKPVQTSPLKMLFGGFQVPGWCISCSCR